MPPSFPASHTAQLPEGWWGVLVWRKNQTKIRSTTALRICSNLRQYHLPLREPKPLRQAPFSADGALSCISSPSNSLNRRPQVLVGDVQGVVGVQESGESHATCYDSSVHLIHLGQLVPGGLLSGAIVGWTRVVRLVRFVEQSVLILAHLAPIQCSVEPRMLTRIGTKWWNDARPTMVRNLLTVSGWNSFLLNSYFIRGGENLCSFLQWKNRKKLKCQF